MSNDFRIYPANAVTSTSVEPAPSVISLTYLEGKVLDAIKAAPRGATQGELVKATGIPSNTITPRFKPLLAKGVVYAGGTRKGASGKNQRVLFAQPGVDVVAATSASAIVRQVEAEQAQAKAKTKIAECVALAQTFLRDAERIADTSDVDFTFDVFSMRGRYVPCDGWYVASYGA